MRNRFVQKISLIWATWLALGCQQPDAPDCFQLSGDMGAIETTLPKFNKIELNDGVHYQLHPSAEYKIHITGPENWINEIEYKVEDEQLIIHDLNHCKLFRSKKKIITIDIYAPAFEEVLNQSFYSVQVMDTLRQSKIKWINENAPANSTILFQGDSCLIEMPKGTGDIHLKGRSYYTSLYSNAIGKLDAHEMHSQYLNCNHNSLQDIHAQAQQYLYVVFQNKGNLILNQSPIQQEVILEDEGQLIVED